MKQKEFDRALFKERLLKVSGGISQLEISKKIGVSASAISKWFNGGGAPSIENLLYLSSEFNCSIDYLLGNDNPDKASESIDTRTFCAAIVQAHERYCLDIESDGKEVLIRINLDKANYSFGDDLEQRFGENYAIIDFLEKYKKIKDAHLDGDLTDTIISALLDKIEEQIDFGIDLWELSKQLEEGK